jgi:hypothetical protein
MGLSKCGGEYWRRCQPAKQASENLKCKKAPREGTALYLKGW